MKITNNTTLSEILNVSGAEKILANHNVPCLTCPMAEMEMKSLKIGEICKMYGIDEKKLIKELNSLEKSKCSCPPSQA